MKIKKINYFRRLFYSWNQLENYFWTEYSQAGMIADDQLDIIQKQNRTLETENSQLKKQKEKDQELRLKYKELETKLAEARKFNADLENKYAKPFVYLEQYAKSFLSFETVKGDLGEKQIKNIITKSGIASKNWTENLIVGSGKVEFAFRLADKWLPVDSKVIETKVNEKNEIIIDKEYINNLKRRAKEIKKYLSKSNTASYGIMVLQNDNIASAIYKKFPNVLPEIINDGIILTSPGTFMQMCLMMVPITETLEKTKNIGKVIEIVDQLYKKTKDYYTAMENTHKTFKIAMEKHRPLVEKAHKKLGKELEGITKHKQLK